MGDHRRVQLRVLLEQGADRPGHRPDALAPGLPPMHGDRQQAAATPVADRVHQRPVHDLRQQDLQRVHHGVAGHHHGVAGAALGGQRAGGHRGRRQVQVGQVGQQRPVGLLRERLLAITGAQAGFQVHHRDRQHRRRQPDRHRGGGVALHQHRGRPVRSQVAVHRGDRQRDQLVQPAVHPLQAEAGIAGQAERGQRLGHPARLLAGVDHHRLQPGTEQRRHQWCDLDRLRPGADHQRHAAFHLSTPDLLLRNVRSEYPLPGRRRVTTA